MSGDPELEGTGGGAYYRRLEVGPGASRDEIVRAYRRLALGVHPDAHPEDPEATRRFREISEAYEVLAHPGRRAAYDRARLGGRFPVHRRGPTTDGTSRGATPDALATREPMRPVFLGPPGIKPTRGLPLRVGPVRVRRPAGADEPRSALAARLFEVLDSWWRR